MTHVVMVESNTSGSGFRAVAQARERGYRVTFVTRSLAHYTGRHPRAADLLGSADEVVETDTNDLPALTARLRTLHARHPVHGVLTYGDYYVETVARLAHALGLPGPDPRAVATARAKHHTRVALAHLPMTPRFEIVARPDQVELAVRRVGLPCVVKPVDRNSGGDVRRVDTVAQARAHVGRILATEVNARQQPTLRTALVEQLVVGEEYSVETFGRHVVGITTKGLTGAPYFVEDEHVFPAGLDADRAALLTATARTALDAIGLDFGPAHTEIKLTAAGPVLVEINPRLGGNLIPDLVGLATGVDLGGCLLDAVTGGQPRLRPDRAEAAGVRFLTADRSGVVTGVGGVAEAAALAGVTEVDVTVRPGARAARAENNNHHLGHVVARAADPEEVGRVLAKAAGTVQIAIQED